MSLASLQSSYDPAAQFGSVTAGSVVSTKSLTVKGVPITGLFSSGALESGYSGLQFVREQQDLSGAFGPLDSVAPTGTLTTDKGSNSATFSDVVTADASGNWSYKYPLTFNTPPQLTLTPAAGSAGPLLDHYDVSGASGYMRFATAQSKFLIAGSGSYGGLGAPVPISMDLPQLNPSFVRGTTMEPTVYHTGQTVTLGTIGPFTSFTTPADLDPTQVSTMLSSFVFETPVDITNPAGASTEVALAYYTLPSTAPGGAGSVIYDWIVPSGATGTGFATESWNQYSSYPLKLTPSTTYYIFAWLYARGSTTPVSPTVTMKVSIPKLTYYSTGAPMAPVARYRSVTVSGGRTLAASSRRE